MSKKQSDVVSASEIAAYAFCPESWRLETLGKEPGNTAELARGKAFHTRIARLEVWSRRAVKAGLLILLLALLLAVFGYFFVGGVGR